MTLELRSRWCACRSPVGLVKMQPKSVCSNKLQKTVVLLVPGPHLEWPGPNTALSNQIATSHR